MNAREAYIALNMIEGLGPVRVRALTTALGSPEAVFQAGETDLVRAERVGPELARGILRQREEVDPRQEIERAARLGVEILTPLDETYPDALNKIYDPPLALYVKGNLVPKDRHAVAIVGSRRCTHYGTTVADRLAYQLAKVGFAVVSGMARGIDTAAHRGALKGGGRTLTVMGSAIDQMYPPENESLAEDIAAQGAVLSEYPLGRPPDRTTFAYRNRIISGLSMGVVVVEAGVKSGALITADAALDQGRSVFAVPGRIDSPAATGPHRLIKTGARLVTDVNDILEEFEMLIPPGPKQQAADMGRLPAVELTAEEEAVVEALLDGELDVDTLSRRANLKTTAVNALLLGLEMKRVVRMLPGRVVALTVRTKPEK